MNKPLIARSAFSRVELSEAQIQVVSGGSDMEVVGPGCGDNGSFTVEPTLKDNKPDRDGHCGD